MWNRAQPKDITQMKCQCIIMKECVTLPQGSSDWLLLLSKAGRGSLPWSCNRFGPRWCLPSLDHKAPYGKLISVEVGPAYVPQRSYKISCFCPAAKKKKRPHFRWKTDSSGTKLFSSYLGAFSSAIWSLWMKSTVFQVCLLAEAA